MFPSRLTFVIGDGIDPADLRYGLTFMVDRVFGSESPVLDQVKIVSKTGVSLSEVEQDDRLVFLIERDKVSLLNADWEFDALFDAIGAYLEKLPREKKVQP